MGGGGVGGVGWVFFFFLPVFPFFKTLTSVAYTFFFVCGCLFSVFMVCFLLIYNSIRGNLYSYRGTRRL